MVTTRRSTSGSTAAEDEKEEVMPMRAVAKKTTRHTRAVVSGAGEVEDSMSSRSSSTRRTTRKASIAATSKQTIPTGKNTSKGSTRSAWKWSLVVVLALLTALASGVYYYDQRQQKRTLAKRMPWQPPYTYVPLKVRARRALKATHAQGMAWVMALEKATYHALHYGKQQLVRGCMALSALGLSGEAKVRAQWHLTPVPMCPEMPAAPPALPMLGDLLRNWPAGDVDQPWKHFGGTVCRFNFGNASEQATALRYRQAGVPFVLYNVTALDAVVAKWQDCAYFSRLIGVTQYRGEGSFTRSFSVATKKLSAEEETCGTKTRMAKSSLFADKEKAKPYRAKPMHYFEWAAEARDVSRNATTPHTYLRVSDVQNHGMYDDLAPLFGEEAPAVLLKDPIPSPRTMTIAQTKVKRSVECTFGMGGAITEAHYTTECMTVAAFNGTLRYLLASPAECAHTYLRPLSDARGRQSEVDWTAPDLKAYPDFAAMKGQEVVLRPGEILSIPSNWLRYQVHLSAETLTCAAKERMGLSQGLDELFACGMDEQRRYY